MATVKVSKDMARQAASSVDWNAIDAMSDEDIARQIAENPDAAPDLTPRQAKLAYMVEGRRIPFRNKVRIVRRALGMSQAQFARTYHLNLRTLQNWEQGTREPDDVAQTFLRLIAFEPDMTRKALND